MKQSNILIVFNISSLVELSTGDNKICGCEDEESSGYVVKVSSGGGIIDVEILIL